MTIGVHLAGAYKTEHADAAEHEDHAGVLDSELGPMVVQRKGTGFGHVADAFVAELAALQDVGGQEEQADGYESEQVVAVQVEHLELDLVKATQLVVGGFAS